MKVLILLCLVSSAAAFSNAAANCAYPLDCMQRTGITGGFSITLRHATTGAFADPSTLVRDEEYDVTLSTTVSGNTMHGFLLQALPGGIEPGDNNVNAQVGSFALPENVRHSTACGSTTGAITHTIEFKTASVTSQRSSMTARWTASGTGYNSVRFFAIVGTNIDGRASWYGPEDDKITTTTFSVIDQVQSRMCYTLNLNFQWREVDGSANNNEHFSPPVLVLSDTDFAQVGTAASPEIESLAETGNPAGLETLVNTGFSGTAVTGRAEFFPFPSGGRSYNNICFGRDSLRTLRVYSMAAPSPDVFVKVTFEPRASGGVWPASVIGVAEALDAGTDAGTTLTGGGINQSGGIIRPLSQASNAFSALTGFSSSTFALTATSIVGLTEQTVCAVRPCDSNAACSMVDRRNIGGAGFALRSCTCNNGFSGSGDDGDCVESTMCYNLNLAFQWDDGLGDEHFSPPVFVLGGDDLAPAGSLASNAISTLSRTGDPSSLLSLVNNGGSDSVALAGRAEFIPFPDFGTDYVNICFGASRRQVLRVYTMVAPSPDWFVKITFDPRPNGGAWPVFVDGVARVYDAGVDSGTDFRAPNSATSPATPITLLNRNLGLFGQSFFSMTRLDTVGRPQTTVCGFNNNPCSPNAACGVVPRAADNTGLGIRTCTCDDGFVGNGFGFGGCTPDVQCYSLAINFDWTQAGLADPHFSPPVLAVAPRTQNFGVVTGGRTPPNLEILAETGNPSPWQSEIGLINGASAFVAQSANGNDYTVENVCVAPTDRLTIFSMLAPSPDWFIMVDFNLHDGQNWQETAAAFISSTQHAYDAGSDSGRRFTSDNLPTPTDQRQLRPLSAANNDFTFVGASNFASLGTITLVRHGATPTSNLCTGNGPCPAGASCSESSAQLVNGRGFFATTCTCNQGFEGNGRVCELVAPESMCYSVNQILQWSESGLTNEGFSPPLMVIAPKDETFGIQEGSAPPLGLEELAETGDTEVLRNFIHTRNSRARSFIGLASGSITENVCFHQDDTLTIFRMVVPSPDWFMMVKVTPYNEGTASWRNDFDIPVSNADIFDAGTDSGPTFTSDDLDTPSAGGNRILLRISIAGNQVTSLTTPIASFVFDRLAPIPDLSLCGNPSTNPCSSNARCAQATGDLNNNRGFFSVECTCNGGFQGNGRVCTPLGAEELVCYDVRVSWSWEGGGAPADRGFSPPVFALAPESQDFGIAVGRSTVNSIEKLAETGETTLLVNRINARAQSISHVGFPQFAPFGLGEVVNNICFGQGDQLSMYTMVVPSPDWFVKATLKPFNAASQTWSAGGAQSIQNSNVYDAGGDRGTTFTSSNDNEPSNSAGRVINRLSDVNNVVLQSPTGAIGTLFWTRIGTAPNTGICNSLGSQCDENASCMVPAIVGRGFAPLTCACNPTFTGNGRQCASERMCYDMQDIAEWFEPNRLAGENPHFSPPVFAIADVSESFGVAAGTRSPVALEVLAETGSPDAMRDIIDGTSNAQAFVGAGLRFQSTTNTRNLCFGQNDQLTVFSMVAPSPDWFLMLRIRPFDSATRSWRNNIVVSATNDNIYDAGSDAGTTFLSQNKPVATGQRALTKLSGAGNQITSLTGDIARFILSRVGVNPAFNLCNVGHGGCFSTQTCFQGQGSLTNGRGFYSVSCSCPAGTSLEGDACQVAPVMCYTLNLRFRWKELGGIAGDNEHFSPPVMVLGGDDLAPVGTIPRAQIETLAETGNPAPLVTLVNNGNNGATAVTGVPEFFPFPVGGTNYVNVCFGRDHRQTLRLYSMAAPSPDWFVKISFNPRPSGLWEETVRGAAEVLDAGTDSGRDFLSRDIDTAAGQRVIRPLSQTNNDRTNLRNFNLATFTLTRVGPKGGDRPSVCGLGNPCHANAACALLPRAADGTGLGIRTCTCNPGYIGNGRSCERIAPTMCYQLNLNFQWQEVGEMAGDNEHFSPLLMQLGGIDYAQIGDSPTHALEVLAETGDANPLLKEIEDDPTALGVIGQPEFLPFLQRNYINICFGRDSMQTLTLYTMAAPSPDWFVKIRFIPRPDTNADWPQTVTPTVEVLDAGTDAGTSFLDTDIDIPNVPINSVRRRITRLSGATTGVRQLRLFSSSTFSLTKIDTDGYTAAEACGASSLSTFPCSQFGNCGIMPRPLDYGFGLRRCTCIPGFIGDGIICEAAGCSGDNDCATGEFCRESCTSRQNECAAYGTEGDQCETAGPPCSQTPCGRELRCTAGICQRPGCRTNTDCGRGTYCRERCEPGAPSECVPFAQHGDACGGFTPACFMSVCAPGLTCVDLDPIVQDEAGECRESKPSECQTNRDCGAGYFCRESCDNANVHECVPYAGPGDSCGGFTLPCFHEQCAPGLTCVDLFPMIADEPGECQFVDTPDCEDHFGECFDHCCGIDCYGPQMCSCAQDCLREAADSRYCTRDDCNLLRRVLQSDADFAYCGQFTCEDKPPTCPSHDNPSNVNININNVVRKKPY